MVGVGDSIDLVNTKFNTIYDSDYTNNLLPHKDDCDNGIVLMVMNSSSYPKEEVPQFIIDYSEPSDNSSTIGKITDDCHNLIRDQIDYFEALRNPLANFTQGSTASDQCKSISDNFDSIESAMDGASDVIANNFIKIQDILSTYLTIFLNLIFSFALVISIGVIILLNIYIWKRIYMMKYFIHVMRNFSMFFLFLGMVVGGVLGVVSEIGYQMAPVVNYIMSPSYLNSSSSLFGDPSSAKYIDTCVNGDGNLYTSMNAKSNKTISIDDFYALSLQYQKYNESSFGLTRSEITSRQLDQFLDYEQDLNLVQDTYHRSIVTMKVNEINQLRCGHNDYYITGTTGTPLDYNHPCMCNHTGSDYSKFDDNCQYIQKVYNHIFAIKNQLLALNSTYINHFEMTQKKLSQFQPLTKSIVTPLSPLLGANGTFTDLFNCTFMRQDLIDFCEQFSRVFSRTTYQNAMLCICSSIFAYVSVYAILCTVYRYTAQARGEKQNITTNEKIELTRNSSPITPRDSTGKILIISRFNKLE